MYIHTPSKKIDISKRTLIMGILNVTPDSFSDGGSYTSVDLAIARAKQMVEDGADMIDIGGESTSSWRPNHDPVSEEEEIERVIPVIQALKEHINIPISIDTYKAKTAEEAVKAGADIINDIWGAKKEPAIAKVAATYNVPIVLMHNRNHTSYNDMIEDIVTEIQESIHIAKQAGVKDEQIIVDPGIGFGKEVQDNFFVMRHLHEIIAKLPYPLLLGASRKRFINEVLDIPAEERDNATGATTCYGIAQGANIVRVHEVKKTKELTTMMDAMVHGVGVNG